MKKMPDMSNKMETSFENDEIRKDLVEEAELFVCGEWEKVKNELQQKIEKIKDLVEAGIPVFKSEGSWVDGNYRTENSEIRSEKTGGIKTRSSHYIGGVDSSNVVSEKTWTPPKEWVHLVKKSISRDYYQETVEIRHIVDGSCLMEITGKLDHASGLLGIREEIARAEDPGMRELLGKDELINLYRDERYIALEIEKQRWEMIKDLAEYLEKRSSK